MSLDLLPRTAYNEDHEAFRQTVRRFMQEEIAPHQAEWAEAGIAFRPSIAWKTLVPGAIVGTYLSLVFWLGGFKWADASVAAVLNQMATIYILVLARLVLGETIVPRQVLGAGFAVAGALVIMLTR